MPLPASAERVAQDIRKSRILPVVREADAESAYKTVDRLVSAGVGVVELTTSIEGWAELLSSLRNDEPGTVMGVGTVTSGVAAELAIANGADFLVSPFPAPEVRRVAEEAQLLFLEGGFTPGEINAAAGEGVAKLFPAHVGGPQYLRSLLAILPGARIVPTGGIRVDAVPDWLAAGAFAVGVGSDLYAGGDLEGRVSALRQLATAGRS